MILSLQMIAILLNSLLNDVPAQAEPKLYGNKVQQGGLPSTCSILSYNTSKTLPCTGSIVQVGNQIQVITSSHCKLPDTQLKVQCDGDSSWLNLTESTGGSVHCSGPNAAEKCAAYTFSTPLSPNRVKSLHPIRMMKKSDQTTFFTSGMKSIQPGVVCQADAMNTDENGAITGKLHAKANQITLNNGLLSQKIESPSLTAVIANIVVRFNTPGDPLCASSGATPTQQKILIAKALAPYGELFLSPGDSGGPLYCKRPKDSEWTLVGVTASNDFEQNYYENRWTPIYLDSGSK